MITNHDLRHEAGEIARAVQASATMTADLRARLIALRTLLFERGIYDPVLGRLDSATVAQASASDVAQQLARLAETLA
jgi:hypothetical protein